MTKKKGDNLESKGSLFCVHGAGHGRRQADSNGPTTSVYFSLHLWPSSPALLYKWLCVDAAGSCLGFSTNNTALRAEFQS